MLYKSLFIFTVLLKTCSTYDDEDHRKFGKDKKLNKAVWIKNSIKHSFFEKPYEKDFIFRPNSIETENMLQDHINIIGDAPAPNQPYSSYFDRSKRSYDEESVKLSLLNDKTNDSVSDNMQLNVKNITSSEENHKFPTTDSTTFGTKENNDINKIKTKYLKVVTTRSFKVEKEAQNEVENNNSTNKMKINRNVFDREHDFWPKTDTKNKDKKRKNTTDKVIVSKIKINGKDNDFETKPAKLTNAKGLNKLIPALTKALKNVMSQFESVKKIESNLRKTENRNNLKVLELNAKVNDVVKQNREFANKIQTIESKIKTLDVYLGKKDKEINAKIDELKENELNFFQQQKSFLEAQQVIVTQNKKLSNKLLKVSKTQKDVFKKQNYLAIVLKAMKDNFVHDLEPQKSDTTLNQLRPNKTKNLEPVTIENPSTENIKINLFKIPMQEKLKNQDVQLLKDKDLSNVDDLIYKFYFNNTFIDGLFKEHLDNIVGADTEPIAKRTDNLKTTILYPVQQTEENFSIDLGSKPLVRERRWINHRSKIRRSHRGSPVSLKTDVTEKPVKKEPFVEMAKNFCMQIGQNKTEQALKWCIEKALRKLQYLDTQNQQTEIPFLLNTKDELPTKVTEVPTTEPTIPTIEFSYTKWPEFDEKFSAFFPGNDELESNLKEFDMTPDKDGNVYYDGSIHTSADTNVSIDDTVSDGKADFDSNEEVDPMVLNMKAKRKAMVKQMKESIIKRLSRG